MEEENKTVLDKAIIEAAENLSKCDTHGGTVHIEWDDDAPVTPFGQFVFFAQFLKVSNLFDDWVNTCPAWTKMSLSPAAEHQATRNLLGTYLLTILAGHKRYAHVTAIRHDKVNPPLLGMTKVYSEDTIRRAFRSINEKDSDAWLTQNLTSCYKPLLKEEWILDVDTTVKSLYGHQEGAEVGYNPHKPGRPSHVIHSYMMAETRLMLDCEVQAGPQTPASYSMPKLLELLNSWSSEERPSLVRGDCAFGNENVLTPLEELGVSYLFKMKQTKKVKVLLELLEKKDSAWTDAGQGWSGVYAKLKLSGWKKERRVLVLRRERKDKKGASSRRRISKKESPGQLWLPEIDWSGLTKQAVLYEYTVLVTSLDEEKLEKILFQRQETALKLSLDGTPNTPATVERQVGMPINRSQYVLSLAQLYRDRATCENNFDELKNQWGWGGFVTQDLLRSQISARIVALTYNWWTLFMRWIDSDKHREGITSRPLMLHGVARQVNHSGKTILKITHLHAKREKIRQAIDLIQSFLQKIRKHAEQVMSKLNKWTLILSEIFKEFLGGRSLSYNSG